MEMNITAQQMQEIAEAKEKEAEEKAERWATRLLATIEENIKEAASKGKKVDFYSCSPRLAKYLIPPLVKAGFNVKVSDTTNGKCLRISW